jgi:elongation factor G
VQVIQEALLQAAEIVLVAAEMTTYATQLRSITGGEGSFSMEMADYDVVPGNLIQAIVAKHKAEKREDDH